MGIERMNPTAAEHSSSSSSSRSSAAFSATTETPAAAPPGPGVTVGGGDVASPPDEQDVTTSSQLSAAAAQGSSRFVGVVPQPNGRWGAQIYDRHDRVWLGTFAIKDAAARAYDVAALRYRGREAATNFPDAGASAPELAFLAAHSKAEIVDMLRKHTYADELHQSLRRGGGGRGRGMGTRAQPTPASARVLLFEKAVTPSDVGRLNRLVLPKQHAEKHLKPRPEAAAADGKGGVLLNFEDGEGKVWRFRYSYWNSSHSHVLTKGWSRFVREKGLRAGDTIVFSHTTYGSEKQLFIHCKKSKVDGVPVPPSAETPSDAARVRVVRLFGVDIAGEGCQKRARPVEKIPFKHGLQELLKSKKQCLGHHRSPAKGVGSLVPRRVAMVGKHNI